MTQQQPTPSRSGKILIADDQETFREATAELLRQEGYECTGAGAADEAIKWLAEREFDLLISDIRMPGNEHLEVLRQLEELRYQIPVIIVTGYPTAETAITSLRAAVFDYLIKPFDIQLLLPKVEQAVMWSQTCRATRALRERLSLWQDDLRAFENRLASARTMRTQALDHLLEIAAEHLRLTAEQVQQLTAAPIKTSSVENHSTQMVSERDALLRDLRKAAAALENADAILQPALARKLQTSLNQLLKQSSAPRDMHSTRDAASSE